MRCSNKEREKVAGYFSFSMAATCVPESQVEFIYTRDRVKSVFLYSVSITVLCCIVFFHMKVYI
uniref:hypothetical protein n=1 Tax=Bacillus cytotoxicus TaxID=580165 RepID=UPI00204167AC